MARPHFHKLILSKTIQERRLRIPDSFVKKFGLDLSTFVRFFVPDSHVWRIGLSKADDKLWFHDGWQKFVERYSIRVGYFLVFRYEGNALFHVHIFNLSASEINYQSNVLAGKRCLVFEEMEDDDYVENLGSRVFDERVDRFTINRIYNHPPVQGLLNGSKPNSFSRGEDEAKIYTPDVGKAKAKKSGRKRKIDPDEQQTPGQRNDGAEMRFRFYLSASVRKRTVTAEERERAMNAAKAFEPVNPFCRVVLRPSYLYRGCIMYLPSSFGENHLNGVSGFIKLQFSDGKQWPVRCLYRGGRAKLSQGWYEFTLENNLGEGDVCIFELLKLRDVVLKVTAFRVTESTGPMNRP